MTSPTKTYGALVISFAESFIVRLIEDGSVDEDTKMTSLEETGPYAFRVGLSNGDNFTLVMERVKH